MNGLCLTSSILYQGTIKCNDLKYNVKTNKGICETNFKKHANQKGSFNSIKSKNDTILSRILNFETKTTSPETYMGNQRTV